VELNAQGLEIMSQLRQSDEKENGAFEAVPETGSKKKSQTLEFLFLTFLQSTGASSCQSHRSWKYRPQSAFDNTPSSPFHTRAKASGI